MSKPAAHAFHALALSPRPEPPATVNPDLEDVTEPLQNERRSIARTIFDLMKDKGWWTIPLLNEEIGCSETGVSATIRLFRRQGHRVLRRYIDKSLWEYQLIVNRTVKPTPRPCLTCKSPLTGYRRQFCSNACARRFTRIRLRQTRDQPVCTRCQCPFPATRQDARYCSSACRQAAYRSRTP